MKYFVGLCLVLAMLQVVFYLPAFFNAPFQANQLLANLASAYPSKLIIQITNGQVSANVPQPFYLAVNDVFPTGYPPPEAQNPENLLPKNLLVIDTNTPFSESRFKTYSTWAWLTKDSLIFRSTQDTRVLDLSKTKNFTLSRPLVDSFVTTIAPYTVILFPLLSVLAFLVIFLIHLFRLIYLFALALVLWLLGKIFYRRWGYLEAYKTGLYAMSLGMLIETLLGIGQLLGLTRFNGFPYMFSLITLVVAMVNIRKGPGPDR